MIEAKRLNPYTPINDELVDLGNALTSLSTALHQLECERNECNLKVTDTSPIKARLTQINNEIAYYDVIELSKKHDNQKLEKETAVRAYQSSTDAVTEKQGKLDELNAKLKSINLAIDVINEGLKYIFFSEYRIQLHAENGIYKLQSNGHAVQPKDVSAAERNIIGLCYFFTEVLEGRNRTNAYGEEYLLVIDDPVSSYDLENKVGIISYLRY